MSSSYRTFMIVGTVAALAGQPLAFGQVSSLGAKMRENQAARPPAAPSREAPMQQRNLIYERYSWISLAPAPPKTFRPGDLVTIIVREQRKYEADADLETRKMFEARSELDAFIKAVGGGIGAAEFRRGKPIIDYRYDNRFKNEGETNREDRLTTRLTAAVIDVKPNGLLVLEARKQIRHDDEISTMLLTGTCRKEDVSPDNTVLSTQLAGATVSVLNEGALRAASSRGWIPRILDWLKPI